MEQKNEGDIPRSISRAEAKEDREQGCERT